MHGARAKVARRAASLRFNKTWRFWVDVAG
jgi:hypothetical protein